MRFSAPHPIPYQGSKRRLAEAILSHVPIGRYTRLVEPFAGSGAVTLAAASQNKFERFLLGDRLDALISLWDLIIADPSDIAQRYESFWLRERERPIEAYYEIRTEFNVDRDPGKLLYLLARCVKNAVRFNPAGNFNQSPDKRRKGTKPLQMKAELYAAHRTLMGRSSTFTGDFMELFQVAQPGDLFYLDPPYQGTSEGRDRRYIEGVSRQKMIKGLELLNENNVPFILSYDGTLGNRSYGDRLPIEIASRVLLDVGRSSQATLNGRDDTTVESLYISHQLKTAGTDDVRLTLKDFGSQQSIVLV